MGYKWCTLSQDLFSLCARGTYYLEVVLATIQRVLHWEPRLPAGAIAYKYFIGIDYAQLLPWFICDSRETITVNGILWVWFSVTWAIITVPHHWDHWSGHRTWLWLQFLSQVLSLCKYIVSDAALYTRSCTCCWLPRNTFSSFGLIHTKCHTSQIPLPQMTSNTGLIRKFSVLGVLVLIC